MNIGEAIAKLEHINWRYCAGNYDVAMRTAIDALRDKQKVERYDEIMQAEREGRLVILPCKRGDPVWRFVWEQVTWPDESRRKIIASNFRLDDIYEIGKTVFLSRDEAEKALEEAKC